MLRLLLILQVAVTVLLFIPANITAEDLSAPEQQLPDSVANDSDSAESESHSNPAYSSNHETVPLPWLISHSTAHGPHICYPSQHCEDVYTPPPLS